MKRNNWMSLAILVVLLVSVVGTAAAQTPEPPTPTPAPAQPSSKFFSHPVVQILSAYFSRNTQPPAADPSAQPTVDPNVTPDPNATPTAPTEVPVIDPQEQLAQEIAAYHEQGLGFGVLVKLYAMAEASRAACPAVDPTAPVDPAAPTCTAVSVDELVTAFKSGSGMGALFKQYGKPALLGVGHVRKANKNQQQLSPTTVPSPEVTTGNGNNGKNGKGPKKNK